MIKSIIQDKPPMVQKIGIFWHIEDVQSIRSDLTDEQARVVLQHLKKNHDACLGINWDVIDCVADILFPEGAAL